LPPLAGSAAAQVKTSMVTIKSGDEEIKGFLARPEGKGPFPAVVVIQEWWGLNDWIKDQAKRIASKGFVALAPDLYRGKVATDMKVASQLMKGLPKDRALRDLKAATDYVAHLKTVDKGHVGTIGWCMGGGYALQLALADPRLKACVICYGRVTSDADELKKLKATVLGIFGEEDKGIPASSVREFEAALKQAGGRAEKINIYKGAGHGFMRENNGPNPNPVYRAEATADAWQQIDRFLMHTLKK